MDSNHLRLIVLILVIAIPLFLNRRKDSLENYIFIYLFFALFGEFLTVVYSGYNLLLYAIISASELGTLSLLVSKESRSSKLSIYVFTAFILTFIAALASDFCLVNIVDAAAQGSPYIISLQQYFDLSMMSSIGHLVLVFSWLLNMVQDENLTTYQINKRYVFILAFVTLYGGTFFMLAVGRFLLPLFEEWDLLWSAIVHPILLVFYFTLFIGLLWKKTS